MCTVLWKRSQIGFWLEMKGKGWWKGSEKICEARGIIVIKGSQWEEALTQGSETLPSRKQGPWLSCCSLDLVTLPGTSQAVIRICSVNQSHQLLWMSQAIVDVAITKFTTELRLKSVQKNLYREEKPGRNKLKQCKRCKQTKGSVDCREWRKCLWKRRNLEQRWGVEATDWCGECKQTCWKKAQEQSRGPAWGEAGVGRIRKGHLRRSLSCLPFQAN